MPTFPVPASFFDVAPLTSTERRRYQSLGRQISADVLRKSLKEASLKWRHVSQADDVQMFQGDDPEAPSRVVTMLGITQIHATLDEVTSLLRVHSDEAFKASRRIIDRNAILDCFHLHTVVDTDTEATDIRWMAYKSPMKKVFKGRDMVLLECQQKCTVENRNAYAAAAASIDLPSCPDFSKTLRVARLNVHRTGDLFIESDRPGILQVRRVAQIDMGMSVPSWMVHFIHFQWIKSMKDLDRCFQEHRLSSQTFRNTVELVPKVARSRCFLCHTSFGFLNKKNHCLKCGEVMCRSCLSVLTVNKAGFDSRVTVCAACTLLPRDLSSTDSVLSSSRTMLTPPPSEIYHRLTRRPSAPQPIVLMDDRPSEDLPPPPMIILDSPSSDIDDDDGIGMKDLDLKSFTLLNSGPPGSTTGSGTTSEEATTMTTEAST
ncbi:hypothetical protein LEN26_010019 [Aphanomyces euteiches]|nr:hypothetical protein LEN26_010019 [Aphanomyces euteiches]KAH9125359.1 hypothetical protein AeMF1_004014 [Aphanomyces euteiches]KAH9188089.1 hypothetical protein AeNC1_009937 [Aphanomyces euteiches]